MTEVITVVWELFLPDLPRGVPEADHEDKRPDVSLLHLSYFVTLMVLSKPQSVTRRPRQAEWKAETEPCSFRHRLAPSHWRVFYSMLHARSWSSGARRRVDVLTLLLLVCRDTKERDLNLMSAAVLCLSHGVGVRSPIPSTDLLGLEKWVNSI